MKEYRNNETEQDPMGLLGMETVGTIANQGREGIQSQGRVSQGTIVRPGPGPGPTSRDTHSNVCEIFIELNPPTNGIYQHSSLQREPSEGRLQEPQKFIRVPKVRLKECTACTSSNNTREDSTHGHHQVEIRLVIFFAAKNGEALYSQQKQDQELTVAQIMNSLLPNSDLN